MTNPVLFLLRDAFIIDFYSCVRVTRLWGRGRSRAAARRRRLRAQRAAAPMKITDINYETKTITVRTVR